MKIPRKKPSKLPLILAIVIPVIIVGVAIAYMLVSQPKQQNQSTVRPVNSVDYGPPTDQDKQETTQNKANIIEQNDTKSPPTTTPGTEERLTVTISRASQLSKGQPLNVRTFVDGATTGNCDVALTQVGQPTVTATFTISFEATSSTCNGDIPASRFSTGGQWQLSVIAKSANLVSSSATQTVKIGL